jgi:hypothetical protein
MAGNLPFISISSHVTARPVGVSVQFQAAFVGHLDERQVCELLEYRVDHR